MSSTTLSPSRRKTPRRRFPALRIAVLPAVCLLFALLAGLSALNRDFWRDEAWTIMATDVPVGMSYFQYYWTNILPIDNNPPLYYLLMRGLRLLFGDNPVAWRFAGIAAGIASILLLDRLARQWSMQRAGLVACALFGLSLPLTGMAWELRTYSFLLTLCLVGALQLRPLLTGSAFRGPATILWAVALVGIMMNYVFVFVVAGYWLFFLLNARTHRRRLFQVTGLFASMALILAVMWLPVTFSQAQAYSHHGSGGTWKSLVVGLGRHFPIPLPAANYRPAGVASLVLLLFYAVPRALRGSLRMRFLVALSLGFGLALVAGSLVQPIFATRVRYYIFALPFLCLIAARLLTGLQPAVRTSLLCVIGLLAIYSHWLITLSYSNPVRVTVETIQSRKPDLIACYSDDKQAQSLNALYYNGLRIPEKLVIWHPRNPALPEPNPSFRHRIQETLASENDIPAALNQAPPPERMIVMIERSIREEERRDQILSIYRNRYSNEEELPVPADDGRSHLVFLYTNP